MPQATKRNKVRNVVRAFCGKTWNIDPDLLESMVEVLELRAAGMELSEAEVAERIASARGGKPLDPEYGESGPVRFDNVAVIPIQGVMTARMNMFSRISGGTSTQQVGNWLKDLATDDSISDIVLDVDSGGGDAQGNEELVKIIRQIGEAKNVVAVVTGAAASAAYYVASAAKTVIMTPSSEVGSIGTFMVHRENSAANAEAGRTFTIIRAGENKALMNDVEPLSEKARSAAQERINSHYQMFVAAVAKNRGVSPDHVLQNFGQGKTFLADQAIKLGMADEIGTLDETIARFRRPSNGGTTGSRLGNSILRGETVNPKLLAFLKTLGAVSADSNEAEQLAALRSMCAASGVAMDENWKDNQESILVDLQAAQLARVGSSQFLTAATTAPAATTGTPPADNVPLSQRQREESARAERSRIQDLQARGQLLSVSQDLINAAIDDGLPVEKALLSWTENLSRTETAVSGTHQAGVDANGRLEFGPAALEKFDTAAVEALSSMMGINDEPLSASAKPLQYKKLLHFAEESLRIQGIRTEGMIEEEIAAAAMALDGDIIIRDGESSYNRPGTFPNLMSALAGKMLLAVDDYSGSTYKQWCYKLNDVVDFKPKTLHQTGEFGEFPLVRDGKNFESSTFSEYTSWIQVDQYGDEFDFTPAMMVNDDLDALTEALRDKNIAHENTQNRLCVNLLTGNVQMPDNYNLFDNTNHGNDLSTGSAPDDDELSAMRLKLRKQSGISGKRKLNLKLEMLLIPSDHETAADKLLGASNLVPNTTANDPIFRGKVKPVVETMLDDASADVYYGFSNPMVAKSIVWCRQRGFSQMRVRIYRNPKNNCLTHQFEGRMAAAARTWRGVVRNAGTGG